MAEWWLLDAKTQSGIAGYLDGSAQRVLKQYDAHHDENSLTAAFCQELVRESIRLNDTTVSFEYRNFPEQNEEQLLGADGGIVITIATPDEQVEKTVLFQAKRLPQHRGTRSLSIPRREASRLKRQVVTMLHWTEESIVLAHTRNGIYAGRPVPLKNIQSRNYGIPFNRPVWSASEPF